MARFPQCGDDKAPRTIHIVCTADSASAARQLIHGSQTPCSQVPFPFIIIGRSDDIRPLPESGQPPRWTPAIIACHNSLCHQAQVHLLAALDSQELVPGSQFPHPVAGDDNRLSYPYRSAPSIHNKSKILPCNPLNLESYSTFGSPAVVYILYNMCRCRVSLTPCAPYNTVVHEDDAGARRSYCEGRAHGETDWM